ncbi:hypothetical protein HYV70_01070 [Candidatus Uhrbacteria bacterium]|nr:hypothetical protein [Candidatus Uhrbacteria bacterium]
MNHNTKEGITSQLSSYETFYALMHLRNEKGGYKSDGTEGEEYGTLEPFILLGRYRSDEFGQCSRLHRKIFTGSDRNAMPNVMTDEEFDRFLNEHVEMRLEKSPYSVYESIIGMTPSFPLPPPHMICARCGKGWDLLTCHDVDAEGCFEELELSLFAGKTLSQVKEELSAQTDALRSLSDPIDIQNPQWVDTNVKQYLSTAEQRGWREVTTTHVVQSEDRLNIYVERFYHGECFRQLNAERIKEQERETIEGIKEILESSGFKNISVNRTTLPEHLRHGITANLNEEEDETVDDIARAFTYYKVQTQQGSFGIAYGAYPMLDLEGSGVSLIELEPQFAQKVPTDFPQIAGMTGEIEQFMRLRQLMKKNRKNP